MIHIETDFRPRLFEWRMLRQTKKDVRRRLEGHEFGRLRIVLKKRAGRIALQFVGDPAVIEKAKGLLGIC